MLAIAREVEQLKKIYEKAQAKVIKIVERQRANNYVDYSSVAQLEKIRDVLEQMRKEAYRVIPKTLEKQYYLSKKMANGKYASALSLTSNDRLVIERLIDQLEAKVTNAAESADRDFRYKWDRALVISRLEPDMIREKTIRAVIEDTAMGGLEKARNILYEELKKDGLTAFTDKLGRKWNLMSYCNMATRTTALQSRNMGLIATEYDLCKISTHAGSCPICKPYEGRVYSKSGLNPNYPSLASAFGKIDPNGPNELYNTYMCIHPNCLHVLMDYTESGKTKEEIDRMREKSNSPFILAEKDRKELEMWRTKERQEVRTQQWIKEYLRGREAGLYKKGSWNSFVKSKLAS